MFFKVVQLIPRRRQGSIHFHPLFQWREPIDFHWVYKVFRLTIRFPGRRDFWPRQICSFYNGVEAFLARAGFWPFVVDSLKMPCPFHVICHPHATLSTHGGGIALSAPASAGGRPPPTAAASLQSDHCLLSPVRPVQINSGQSSEYFTIIAHNLGQGAHKLGHPLN